MRSRIGKLLLGNGLGQAIQFSSILLFSRIYAPGDFGVLGQIQSYATVFAVFCTLQMHLSLPLCKNSEQARSLVSAIVTVCYAIVIAAFPFALWLGKIYVYALLLAMAVGLSNTFNGYLIFGGNFGNISRFYVLRSLAIVVVQTVLGLSGASEGLVWGALAGEGLTAIYLAARSRHSTWPFVKGSVQRAIDAVKERRAFALYGTMQEIVSVSAFYAPLFFFARIFNDEVVGQYAMASRLVWAPVILFTSSLTQVLYHEIGKKTDGHEFSPSYLKLPHIAYYPVLMAAPVVCFILRDLVTFALGSKWHVASEMLAFVVGWGVAFIIATPARAVCRMLRQQKIHLVIDLSMLLGIAFVFYVDHMSPVRTMAGILIVAIVQNLMMIITARMAMRSMPAGRQAV